MLAVMLSAGCDILRPSRVDREGGTERKISMKWIALVHVTPLFSLLSHSKLVPEVSSSFHPRGEIERMRGCV